MKTKKMSAFKLKKIEGNSLGEKLKTARTNKGLEFIDIYRASGIEIKHLKALEQENWDSLPGEIYLKNFLKKYCEYLGLNYKLCLRQYNKEKITVIENKSYRQKGRVFFKSVSNYITPKRLTLILLSVVVVVFIGFIILEVVNYVKPPMIKISYPEKEYTTVEDSILIKGKTEPESILFINNEAVGVSENGDFSVDVKLKPGLNRFELISQKKHSRKNYEQIIIYQKVNL